MVQKIKEKIGKGAYATVYRAEYDNGESIAVKSIDTSGISHENLDLIMIEVKLLKNLDHPNIVKYYGFKQTLKHANIILEYCENGSLADMCKKYGKIPEHIAALYVEDVLHGLVYLHDQGIIHRDIKGANLLISAEGVIKLADFGVATSAKLDGNCTVVGTPHWMAPEIIELKGALSATDIWSLGCTVVELLTCHPPYYKKPAMVSAFAIVTENTPPIPDGVSESATDFLHLCFIKEPKFRASAKRLLRHRWITSAKELTNKAIRFDDAVKLVKDWNKAMQGSKKAKVLVSTIKPTILDDNSANLSTTTIPPTNWQFYPYSFLNENSSYKEKSNNEYSFSDLEGDIDLSKFLRKYNYKPKGDETLKRQDSGTHNEETTETNHPQQPIKSSQSRHHHTNSQQSRTKSLAAARSPLKLSKNARTYVEEDDEQHWSDSFVSNDLTERTFSQRIEDYNSHRHSTLLRFNQSNRNYPEHLDLQEDDQCCTTTPSSPFPISSENFDAEIEDAFDHNSLDSEYQLNLHVLASQNIEIHEIAAKLKPLSISTQDLSHHLNSLVSILTSHPKTQTSLAKCNPLVPLVQILDIYQEEHAIIINALDVLYVLLGTSSLIIQKFCLLGGVPSLLQLADIHNPLHIRYKACLIIEKFLEASKFATGVILANGGISTLAQFVNEIFGEQECLRLVEVGIKGIFSIFKMQGKSLISELGYQLSQYQILGSLVFALDHFFCLKQDIFDLAIDKKTHAAVTRASNVADIVEKLISIFVVFSKMESDVRDSMLDSTLFAKLFRLVKRMEPFQQARLLKFFQSLSTTPQGVDTLLKASAFRHLISILKKAKTSDVNSQQYLTIGECIFSTIQNMCVMVPVSSKHKLNDLVDTDAIPYLREAADISSPLKKYALDILFKIINLHSQPSVRTTFLHEGILQLFLKYVADPSAWQPSAYDAISTWLENDRHELEPELVKLQVSKKLVQGLGVASIETVFDYFLKMIMSSSRFCFSVASSEELWAIIHKRLQTDDPFDRLILLKIVRAILDNVKCIDAAHYFCRKLGVERVIETLAQKETAVLVKALSDDILKKHFSAVKLPSDEPKYVITHQTPTSFNNAFFGSGSNGSVRGLSTATTNPVTLQNQQNGFLLPTVVKFSKNGEDNKENDYNGAGDIVGNQKPQSAIQRRDSVGISRCQKLFNRKNDVGTSGPHIISRSPTHRHR